MKKDEDIQVGHRIKAIRSELNMNQKEFSEKINSTVQALSNWENGRNKPNTVALHKISELGGISVDELLYGYSNLYHDIEDYLKEYFYEEVVGRLKNAEREPKLKTIDRRANALDLPIEELLYGKKLNDDIITEFEELSVSDLDTEQVMRVQAVANNVLLDCMMELHKRGIE